jgi:hypothetical protein
MRCWPQDEHQTMHAISLLKHVVVMLGKSEGLRKWLAPCGTDVHRVARTIDVSILEKDSHRQNKMILRNEVLRAQNIENLGARSVCLLEQLRPLLRTWTYARTNLIVIERQIYIGKATRRVRILHWCNVQSETQEHVQLCMSMLITKWTTRSVGVYKVLRSLMSLVWHVSTPQRKGAYSGHTHCNRQNQDMSI